MVDNAPMLFRIKQIRGERGLTQQQLADMAGLSKSFISQLENGQREPGANTMQVLAEVLRVKVTDLMDANAQDAGYLRALELFRQLGDDDRAAVVMMAEALLRQREGK